MLKQFSNQRALAVFSEYLLIFFLVLGAITAMAVFFRRAIQARIYESRNAGIELIRRETAGYYDGDIYSQYEPYYTNTDSQISQVNQRRTFYRRQAWGAGSSQSFAENRYISSYSETRPPREAN